MGSIEHLADLQDALAALADKVGMVDIRAYESLSAEALLEQLHPAVVALLDGAMEAVSRILLACEGLPHGGLASPYVPFEHAVDAAIKSQAKAPQQTVADIAFLAKLELHQRRERLSRLPASVTALAVVDECDSALRRIRKALASLDLAIARAGLGVARLHFTSELEVSLRVRKACAKLRARILSAGTPTPEGLRAHLRGAGTALAVAVGWDVYPQLRVRDRLQLRELQRRVLDWLREPEDAVAGLRLWQDLVAFIRLLAFINRRQELVEHDTLTIQSALERLGTCGPSVPEDLIKSLMTLTGLDDDVDALLASSARADAAAWVPALHRVAQRLPAPPWSAAGPRERSSR